MNKEKEYIFRLMYSAFIQIREEAYERKDKKSFRICDLLHNIPLKILNVDNDIEYKEIYQDLVNNVRSTGMEKWFNNEVEQIDLDTTTTEF